MKTDIDASNTNKLTVQECLPPPHLQNSLRESRQKLRVSAGVGLILSIFVLFYCIWIIGEALLESGVTRADMFAFGLFYVLAIAIPIELVVSFVTYRQLSKFAQMRIRLGVHGREPTEKLAMLSIILCLAPILCLGIIIVIIMIVSLFTFALGKL